MKKMFASIAIALVATAMTALPAAADTTCTGTIGATTIDDNVIVPADATCTLDGTTVDGNVLVGQRARLTVVGADISGNIQDDNSNAGAVEVRNSSTDNIQLDSGTSLTVRNTLVDGDLQFEQNRGPLVAHGNDINGNLQVNQNSGGATITTNRIDGNLQCQSNSPAPTGGDNVVNGSAEGQCSDLEEPAPTGFTDVEPGSTHATAITWLVDRGIARGYDDGTFRPTVGTTRQAAAAFLHRYAGEPDVAMPGEPTFSDVPASHPFAAEIEWLAATGLTEGYDDGTFRPGAATSRQAMAAFFHRYDGWPADG